MGSNAGLFMAAAGAGYSASANMQAGKDQARLQEYNAQVADMQADDAVARGRTAEDRHRVNVRRLIGSQRAAFANSGQDPNIGNAVDVQGDTASLGELDALTIRLNAAREAWGYKVQSIDYRARGELAEAEGKSKALGNLLSTGGSLLYNKFGFGATTRTTK